MESENLIKKNTGTSIDVSVLKFTKPILMCQREPSPVAHANKSKEPSPMTSHDLPCGSNFADCVPQYQMSRKLDLVGSFFSGELL